LLIGWLGYLSFGPNVQGSVIDNIGNNVEEFGKTLVAIVNFGFMMTAGLSFPMLFFNCRNFVMSVVMDIMNVCAPKKKQKVNETIASTDLNNQEQLLEGGPQKQLEKERQERMSEAIEDNPVDIKRELNPEEEKQAKTLNILFYVVSITMLVALVLLADFVEDFDSWISWIAGIAANSIAFILPALFYIFSTFHKKNNIWYRLAITSLVLGTVSLVLNVFSNFYKAFSKS